MIISELEEMTLLRFQTMMIWLKTKIVIFPFPQLLNQLLITLKMIAPQMNQVLHKTSHKPNHLLVIDILYVTGVHLILM